MNRPTTPRRWMSDNSGNAAIGTAHKAGFDAAMNGLPPEPPQDHREAAAYHTGYADGQALRATKEA